MKAIILLNPLAGSSFADRERLSRVFARAGIEAIVEMMDVSVPAEVVWRAAESSINVIVAAGGDGTISTVAAGISGKKKKLGIIPIGTLNHFARDLRIPTELEAAARVIRRGKTIPVDTGELNGRIFLNNSSIGVYPLLARERKKQRRNPHRGKWGANIAAAVYALQNFPQIEVRLKSQRRVAAYQTPLIFIGNNTYEWTLFSMAHRSDLSQGELFICVSQAKDPLQLVVEGLFRTGQLEMFTDEELMVETKPHNVLVALDGEVLEMDSPLYYRVLPRSLEVFVP